MHCQKIFRKNCANLNSQENELSIPYTISNAKYHLLFFLFTNLIHKNKVVSIFIPLLTIKFANFFLLLIFNSYWDFFFLIINSSLLTKINIWNSAGKAVNIFLLIFCLPFSLWYFLKNSLNIFVKSSSLVLYDTCLCYDS